MLIPTLLTALAPLQAPAGDTLRALRLDPPAAAEMRLDGHLTESFWARAVPIDDLRQREPDEGAPATEVTEIRLAYDDEAIYVGVTARDSEPDQVVARILQRDRIMSGGGFGGLSGAGDDVVALILDPFQDHRNGVVLATNPNGARFDALLSDEGGQINSDWRGLWEVAATRSPEGWSAEFEIPWRTLRYPGGDAARVWGFNVTRLIPRKQEEILWRSWQRVGGGFGRVSLAGHIAGLDGLPRPGLNVEVKPYALAGLTQTRDAEARDVATDREVDVGLDLKSELRPGLVLDVTVNTDFAQVEVDDQQVNLTRFDLFFPEKRDFFLENAGIFDFGQEGFFEPPPYLMFFSRRIGIGPEGQVPILGGGRLSGRVGDQTVGLLSVVTDDVPGREKETFNVARVKRDVGGSAYLGAMLTDRRGDGPTNTVVGIDGQIYLHPTLLASGFAARSATEGEGGDGLAYELSFNFTADLYGGFFQFFTVEPDAVASAGFVTRTDVRRTQLTLRRSVRPSSLGLRRVDVRVSGQYQSTLSGRFQDVTTGISAMVPWETGDNLSVDADRGESRVDAPFTLADSLPVPAGKYRTDRWSVNGRTSSARPWRLSARASGSDFFGGDRRSWGDDATIVPTPSLALTAGFSRDHVDLPSGSFTADITSLRFTWALSTRVTTNALVQYNALTDDLIANLRFNLIHRPGSDLYVVFTEARSGEGDDDLLLQNRGMVVKLTWLARF
jgi:hypothetical protein